MPNPFQEVYIDIKAYLKAYGEANRKVNNANSKPNNDLKSFENTFKTLKEEVDKLASKKLAEESKSIEELTKDLNQRLETRKQMIAQDPQPKQQIRTIDVHIENLQERIMEKTKQAIDKKRKPEKKSEKKLLKARKKAYEESFWKNFNNTYKDHLLEGTYVTIGASVNNKLLKEHGVKLGSLINPALVERADSHFLLSEDFHTSNNVRKYLTPIIKEKYLEEMITNQERLVNFYENLGADMKAAKKIAGVSLDAKKVERELKGIAEDLVQAKLKLAEMKANPDRTCEEYVETIMSNVEFSRLVLEEAKKLNKSNPTPPIQQATSDEVQQAPVQISDMEPDPRLVSLAKMLSYHSAQEPVPENPLSITPMHSIARANADEHPRTWVEGKKTDIAVTNVKENADNKKLRS